MMIRQQNRKRFRDPTTDPEVSAGLPAGSQALTEIALRRVTGDGAPQLTFGHLVDLQAHNRGTASYGHNLL